MSPAVPTRPAEINFANHRKHSLVTKAANEHATYTPSQHSQHARYQVLPWPNGAAQSCTTDFPQRAVSCKCLRELYGTSIADLVPCEMELHRAKRQSR